MKNSLAYISGLALMSAAVIGILFSLSGFVLLGVYAPRTTSNAQKTLDRLSNAMTVTASGLELAHSAVEEADTALDSLSATMEGINTSMTESQPSLKAISDLLGTELPNTIRATQDSLDSAETSAKNIDGLLTNLSKIPFLGTLVYNPKVPLNVTIGGVSDSLADIPKDLEDAQKGLDLTIETMDSINRELGSIAESTDQIRGSTDDTLQIIEDYQIMVGDLQKDVERMQTNLPRTLRLLTAAAVAFLIWLGLVQIGFLLQGLDLIKRSKESRRERRTTPTSE